MPPICNKVLERMSGLLTHLFEESRDVIAQGTRRARRHSAHLELKPVREEKKRITRVSTEVAAKKKGKVNDPCDGKDNQ